MSFMVSSVIDVCTLRLALNSILCFRQEIDDFDKLTLINNEYKGIIDFNGLLPVSPSVSLLPFWHINCYSCHLWGTHLMYVIAVHHMDDAGLMDNAIFLLFCYIMDEGDFYPLQAL